MKRTLLTLATVAAALAAGTAQAGANVGVSISIGQPGFYGQIDLGNAPPPQLVYAQPMIIERVSSPLPPLYLRVPLGYERHWKQHCYEYRACGRPVYFVRDDWYNNVYAPHYRDHYYGGGWHDARRVDRDHDGIPDNRDRDHGQGWANGHDDHRDNRRDDHHDNRRDDRKDDHRDDRGRGHDKDRDHDH